MTRGARTTPFGYLLLAVLVATCVLLGVWWGRKLVNMYAFLGTAAGGLDPGQRLQLLLMAIAAGLGFTWMRARFTALYGYIQFWFAVAIGWQVLGRDLTNNRMANALVLIALAYVIVDALTTFRAGMRQQEVRSAERV